MTSPPRLVVPRHSLLVAAVMSAIPRVALLLMRVGGRHGGGRYRAGVLGMASRSTFPCDRLTECNLLDTL